MEIIADNEEIRKLSQNNNFEKIKVCLNGIYSSGKTTFLKRITSQNNFNIFKESIKIYRPANIIAYFSIFIKYKGKSFHLDFLDYSRQERYLSLRNFFLKDSHAILNFYDPFNKDSFKYIKKSYQSLKNKIMNFFIYILIKNKCDLNETKDKDIIISDKEVLEFVDENNLLFRNLSNLWFMN